MGKMLLGTRRDDDSAVEAPSSILTRHAAMLGSTGSGKTVMAKALIEEATLSGIPSLVIDPQGDLARLCLNASNKTVKEKGGDPARRKAFEKMAEVRIWTPLRKKGLPICIDPFKSPPAGLEQEEAITAWDMVAAGFTSLADYDMEKPQGKQVRSYLYEILVHTTRLGMQAMDFQALARVIREPHHTFTKNLTSSAGEQEPEWLDVSSKHGLPDFEDMLPRSTREELGRRVASYSSGVNQLLFSNGVPVDIDTLIEPASKGKVPINVIYLNTIQSEAQKHYFVQEIARTLYDWMLDHESSPDKLNLLFFMDEVAPYLPPAPRNPPAKDLIKLIFKQARKYGVSAVLATQNVSDVDYKILAQANTLFIGRFTQPQDIGKVKHLLKESGGDLGLVKELPQLGPGQFQMVSPDVSDAPIPLQCRWLYTDHGAPFTEEQVSQHTPKKLRKWATKRSTHATREVDSSTSAAAAAGRDSRQVPPGLSGMAAASKGATGTGDAFEVRLMGGLSVIRDGRDPLYVMQGIANSMSTLVLIWSMVILLMQWRDGTLQWHWALLAFSVTFTVCLIIGLEAFLGHDAEMQRKISRFARFNQYGLALWLWTLVYWEYYYTDYTLGHGLATALEVSVLWITLFLVLEAFNRIRLGRLDMSSEREGLLSKIREGMGSLKAVLTQADIGEMRASSRQVMSGLRWSLDLLTMLLFASIAISIFLGHAPGELLGGDDMPHLFRLALWFGSVYFLIFAGETIVRYNARKSENGL